VLSKVIGIDNKKDVEAKLIHHKQTPETFRMRIHFVCCIDIVSTNYKDFVTNNISATTLPPSWWEGEGEG